MRFLAMTVANFKMTIRNKQALFFTFIFPILFIMLFGVIFGGGQGEARLAIADKDGSALATSITKGIEDIDRIQVDKATQSEGLRRLKKGRVDAVLVFEEGFSKEFPKQPAAIKLYYDPASVSSQMMQGTVSAVLNGVERSMIKTPPLITVKAQSVQSNQLRYIDFLLPGVLAMSLMNSGLYGIANVTVSRREKGVLRRLKLTPMPLNQFIGAGIANQLIVSVMQAIVLIVVGYFAFDVKIVGNILPLFAVIVIGSICFITLGFTIASFANTADAAATLGNIIGMPMMFLGGVFFPVDNAPAWIKPLVNVLPLKYLADSLRAVMVQGQGLMAIRNDLLILIAVTLVLFVISVKFFRWESSKR